MFFKYIKYLLIIILVGFFLQGNKIDTEFEKIFKQMFPELKFHLIDVNKIKTDKEKIFFIERIIFGKFISDENEFLVIVRCPKENLAHAEGFYHAYVAVFNSQGILLTPVKHFIADEGNIGIFRGKKSSYLFFVGNVTFQGWSEWQGGLYKITPQEWIKVWPEKGFFEDGKKAIQIGQDRIIIYTRKILNKENKLIPNYKYEINKELIWDYEQEKFEG